MITWARGVILVLVGGLVGLAAWHHSNVRAIEAERQRTQAIDGYQVALSRFVNGDFVLMQIEKMREDKGRLDALLPPDFADPQPLIERAATESSVVIQDVKASGVQEKSFHAQRSIELSGTGDYRAIARFAQALEEARGGQCSQGVCRGPLRSLREAHIELAPSGGSLAFRFTLDGYRLAEHEDMPSRTQVKPAVAEASPDAEANQIISELKSRMSSPLEALPLIEWLEPGPERTFPGDPFRLSPDQ